MGRSNDGLAVVPHRPVLHSVAGSTGVQQNASGQQVREYGIADAPNVDQVHPAYLGT